MKSRKRRDGVKTTTALRVGVAAVRSAGGADTDTRTTPKPPLAVAMSVGRIPRMIDSAMARFGTRPRGPRRPPAA